MKVNNMINIYAHGLFFAYLPIAFIMHILNVTGKSFLPNIFVILILYLIGFILLSLHKIKLDLNSLYVFLFISYCFILISIHYLNGDIIDHNRQSLFEFHWQTLLLYTISYLYGKYSNFSVNKISYLVLLITLLFTFFIIDTKTMSLNFDLIDEDKKGVYLILGGLQSVFLLFFITRLENNFYKFLLLTLGCITLFFLNSRSALYSFIIVIAIYQILFSDIKNKIYTMLGVTLFVFFLIGSSVYSELLETNPRMLTLVTGISEDGSQQARNLLYEVGISRIKEAPLLGDYGGTIRDFGSIGSYIHNILSYWQVFGLIPFLASVYFFIIQTSIIAYNSYKYRKIRKNSTYFVLAIYLMLSLITAKSYVWYTAWFILGYLHTYNRNTNNLSY